ncbi:MAG: hypothetical protein M3304_07885 [Actinomycetota bacterium]|nr:hypothetical protein [Actinomycetota bacterium]
MSRTPTNRPIPLALTTLVALFSALVALAVTGGHDAAAHGSDEPRAIVDPTAGESSPIVTQRELALRNEMRRLWEDHVTWTRLAIISLTTGAPDTEATVGRLLENQTDIGDAIKPFYGEAAGEELTRLLREHIVIAADLIAAAKAGDQEAVVAAQSRWTANADEIAGFLASANEHSWKLDEMKAMLREHLRLTTDEALARLHGDWAADVAAYDEIHLHALGMADTLSTGIVEEFPKRFH